MVGDLLSSVTTPALDDDFKSWFLSDRSVAFVGNGGRPLTFGRDSTSASGGKLAAFNAWFDERSFPF